MSNNQDPNRDAAAPPASAPAVQQVKRTSRGLLPPELIAFIIPAVQVGAATGGAGAALGLVTGIVRDCSPVLFSLFAGFQCFALGSTYWLSRTAIARAWGGPIKGEQSLSRGQMITASSIAGGTAGMVGGLIRGPRNIIPGIIAFSVYGTTGQAIYHMVEDWQARAAGRNAVVPRSEEGWLSSKWSPLKRLSDKEYGDIMREKILRLDVEISLLDDRIAELKSKDMSEENMRGVPTAAHSKIKT